MERDNRPKGREKRITDNGKGVKKRGQGLNLGGPVGSGEGFGSPSSSPGRRSGGAGFGRGGRPSGLVGILVVIACLVFGGGSFFSGNSGGYGSLGGSVGQGGPSASGGLAGTGQTGAGQGLYDREPDTSVASGARQKRTVIKGGGQDKVTVMVYMCGTDLESKNGMATADLQEMTAAKLNDNINVLVYTGGCSGWKNSAVSSQVNQIYQVKDGKLVCLEPDMGDVSMTDPKTLTRFLNWCKEKYPANRMDLIFWDHGGGSVSGYGYDQKYPRSGSMSLADIDQALKDSKISFDFIGFDACLMATMENGLMLAKYGDYMIASEETEPGYGWYYTDWLTKLAQDTSMSTLDIGKQIADDFVLVCTQKGQGSSTTLSLVDLAELETTAPKPLAAFSRSASKLIQDKEYKAVSDARAKTKEFARSSGIDQVDLVNLAENMGTDEGMELAKVLRSAVKYNITSPSIANAYGISIYFPYKKVSSVDSAVKTYEKIGMDEDYSRCIQEFASLEVAGQAASGGASSPLPALLGTLTGEVSSGDAIAQVLGSLLSGQYGGIPGLDSSNMGFLSGRSLEDMADYLGENQFDPGGLVWQQGEEGLPVINLSEAQWDLVQNLELNVFFDDGEGYIDLGLDNVFQFDDNGRLLGDYDRTWLAIDGQPVAYYFLDETRNGDDYTITGRVPAMLNGQHVDLMLLFDQDNPYGYVEGARIVYKEETDTIAKGLTQLQPGDTIEFLCDYYGYDGTFLDNYYLGEPMVVDDDLEISNVDVGDGNVRASYRVTDIYNQHYWTAPLEGE